MNPRLASAIEFARIGCRVVPVGGKNPGRLLGDEWQHQASRDEKTLRGWWEEWPEANVGIVGGRALVPLDVDDPESFERLQAETAPAPPTPRYLTGGAPGRERLLFAHPGDDSLDRLGRVRKIVEGVQLRDERPESALMSLVPPSVHPDTGVTTEWTIALDDVPLAQIPEPWFKRMWRPNGKPAGRPKSEWAATFTRRYETGCRETHPTFVSMAGRLVPAVGAVATFELLRAWNVQHCQPPKPEGEIRDAIAWVARRELGR